MRGTSLAALLLTGACAVQHATRIPCMPPSKRDEARILREESRELGSGFRLVTRQIELLSGFEEFGYFGYLYYRDQELSEVGTYSVAPNGRSIAFQDAPTGDIVLFIAESRTCFRVRDPGAVVVEYTWDEDKHELWLRRDSTEYPLGPSVRVPLP